jgi:hypothetical protein
MDEEFEASEHPWGDGLSQLSFVPNSPGVWAGYHFPLHTAVDGYVDPQNLTVGALGDAIYTFEEHVPQDARLSDWESPSPDSTPESNSSHDFETFTSDFEDAWQFHSLDNNTPETGFSGYSAGDSVIAGPVCSVACPPASHALGE